MPSGWGAHAGWGRPSLTVTEKPAMVPQGPELPALLAWTMTHRECPAGVPEGSEAVLGEGRPCEVQACEGALLSAATLGCGAWCTHPGRPCHRGGEGLWLLTRRHSATLKPVTPRRGRAVAPTVHRAQCRGEIRTWGDETLFPGSHIPGISGSFHRSTPKPQGPSWKLLPTC